jgi:DnaK suppressor protein
MDAEDLTEEQIEAYRQTLLELKDELTAALRSTDESSKTVELDQAAFGRLSRIDAIQQQQMSKAYRGRVRIRLQQVKAALSAIDRGDYGHCNACGEPIALKRLEIRPESPICVECQSEREV